MPGANLPAGVVPRGVQTPIRTVSHCLTDNVGSPYAAGSQLIDAFATFLSTKDKHTSKGRARDTLAEMQAVPDSGNSPIRH
jgi:hypothetical protein